jgi:hypothetical protein
MELPLPEGHVKIIDLVAIARFVGGKPMQPQEEESEEEVQSESEESCELEESLPSEVSTEATKDADFDSSNYCKTDLEIPQPVVYSGTFQDYKKEVSKFRRFRTLASFTRAVQFDDGCKKPQSRIQDPAATSWKPNIIDCNLPSKGASGVLPYQLVALAIPPSVQCKHAAGFVALSKALSFESVAARKRGAAVSKVEVPIEPASRKTSALSGSAATTSASAVLGQSPYRFHFPASTLQKLRPNAFAQTKLLKAHQMEETSSWRIDDASSSAPRWFSGRTQLHQGAVLEPILKGKIALDAPAVVTLPKIPGRWSGSMEQGQEAMRMCFSAVPRSST